MKAFRSAILATALTAASVLIPAQSSAQAIAMLGLSAGAAVPMGKISDPYSTGFNAMASLGFGGGEEIPVSLRFEGAYTKFNGSTTTGTAPVSGMRIWSGNVSAIVSLPGGEIVRPYALAGGGVYNMKSMTANAGSSNDFGMSGGIGVSLDLSGFNTFAEARINHVFTENGATRFAPIVFGILF
jgi:opacity protein-like surface antigen